MKTTCEFKGTKDYKCAHCEKLFMQRQHLVAHERRHTGDKRHKCDECGKAFVEPATLRNHLKTHKNLNTNTYLVNQGETYFGPSGLRVHSLVAGTNEGHYFKKMQELNF